MAGKWLGRVALAALTLAGLGSGAVGQTTNLRAQTGAPGSTGFIFMTAMQSVLQKHLPVQINITTGAAATRSTLDATRGNVDLFTSAPSINYFMSSKTAMFKDMADAPEKFKKHVRSILNYPLGPYHIIVYESSGIKELADMKGKKAFIGPPGGAATVVALAIIEGATGYKANVDYQQVRLDWNSGQQAFQDKQVDIAIFPTELPSPMVAQFALLDKIRLITIPEKAFSAPAMKKTLSLPGRTIMEIAPGTYGKNQVNDSSVKAVGSWIGLSTRTEMDEEMIYKITKTIFENIKDIHAAAPFLKEITKETALLQMNAPLHKGALRYYREIGLKIDPSLVPPEAK
ncbi:MAG: TAXI family TRAP transporter solute-binding subunit [Hyphomicrobiaceae bacterium]